MTLRQLIRRPRTTEEAAAQAAFYRSIVFGVACTLVASLLALGGVHG